MYYDVEPVLPAPKISRNKENKKQIWKNSYKSKSEENGAIKEQIS